jgi:NADH:ubiquinone oxidoreductase subunit E
MIRDIENKSKKELIEMLEIAQDEYRNLLATKSLHSVWVILELVEYEGSTVIAIADSEYKAIKIRDEYDRLHGSEYTFLEVRKFAMNQF